MLYSPRRARPLGWLVVFAAAAARLEAQPEAYAIDPTASHVRIHLGRAGLMKFLGHEHQIEAPLSHGRVEVVDGGTAGMDLLDTLASCDHLLICDAVRTGGPPGSVVKLAGDQIPALFQTRCSPHQLGLSDLLATLTLTGEVPATLTLIGIIPADLGLGLQLSDQATEAAGRAVEELAAELRELGYPLGPKCLAAGAVA